MTATAAPAQTAEQFAMSMGAHRVYHRLTGYYCSFPTMDEAEACAARINRGTLIGIGAMVAAPDELPITEQHFAEANAIANADEHLSAVGLPSYSELAAALAAEVGRLHVVATGTQAANASA